MSEHLLVLCTVPDEPAADRISEALVTARLAACVNRLGGLRSRFRWEGAVQDEDELLLVIKTRAAAFEALRQAIAAVHPYSVPEIIALPIVAGHAPYLAWIDSQVDATVDGGEG